MTPVPSFCKSRISQFDNRQDLIRANMASVHLVSTLVLSLLPQHWVIYNMLMFVYSPCRWKPWFLDGKLTSNFRGKPHIDGSFLARPSDYFGNAEKAERQPTILLDFKRDPLMKERAIELIKVVSKQTIWDILERGKAYGKIMDVQGEFRSLSRSWQG